MRLLSQSSTAKYNAETNLTSVANPSDENNDIASAPPNVSLLQNEGMLNNETPTPPNVSLSQNEGASQHHVPPPEAQIEIANNLASDSASKTEPSTF